MGAYGDVRQELPVVASDGLLEVVDQPAPIRVITDQILPGTGPRHHAMGGPSISIQSRHGTARIRTLDWLIVQPKTKVTV